MTPDTETAASLAAFAADHGHALNRTRCFLCNIPLAEEQQVQQGKAAGVPYRIICSWLESLGHEHVTKGRIERHFHGNHIHPDTQEAGA